MRKKQKVQELPTPRKSRLSWSIPAATSKQIKKSAEGEKVTVHLAVEVDVKDLRGSNFQGKVKEMKMVS